MNWFLRRLIRRNFRELPSGTVQAWDRRLKFLYLFCCWNAAGIIAYHFYTLPDHKKKDYSAEAWASYFKVSDAKIIKIRGLTEVRVTDYHAKPDSEAHQTENSDAATPFEDTPLVNPSETNYSNV